MGKITYWLATLFLLSFFPSAHRVDFPEVKYADDIIPDRDLKSSIFMSPVSCSASKSLTGISTTAHVALKHFFKNNKPIVYYTLNVCQAFPKYYDPELKIVFAL